MAMFAFAAHLQEGKGVPQNYKKAAKYFKMSADLGHKESMYAYSKLLGEGLGVEKNEEEVSRYIILVSYKVDDECLIQ